MNVSNIEEYLKWVKKYEDMKVCFRGQADENWKLLPSVFRKCPQNNQYPNEYRLFNHSKNVAWRYLQHCKTNLDKMVVLQHYRLKTRLLDLTFNPLVALYFACAEEMDTKGAVYCFTNVTDCAEKYASVIADAISLLECECIDCNAKKLITEEQLELWEKEYKIQDKFSLLKKKLAEPLFFHSPYNNERIISQKGAFIIAPLFTPKGKIYKGRNMDYRRMNNIIDSEFAIIKNKRKLLKELDLLGINESTIYPDLEHLLKYLNCEF